MPLNEGDLVGGIFRVESLIGRGGMGEVYRARDTIFNRHVALKTINREPHGLASNAARRFRREARALARLSHPSVVSLLWYGLIGDQSAAMACELLDGTLETFYKSGPDPAKVHAVARAIAHGVEHAHALGILHRDLKPQNIMFRGQQAVLVDFGIAKLLQDEDAADETNLTIAGLPFGSPGYMPPEQANGETATERSDIFSFGAVLYYLLHGRPPFPGKTKEERLVNLFKGDPQFSRTADPLLARIARRCLHNDPAARYTSMREVVAELGVEHVSRSAETVVEMGSRIEALLQRVERLLTPLPLPGASYLAGSAPWSPTPEPGRVEHQSRHYEVDEDGIAKITVTLRGLHLSGPITIASPDLSGNRGFHYQTEDRRNAAAGVDVIVQPYGQLQLVQVKPRRSGVETEVPELKVTYWQSNAFGLSIADRQMMKGDQETWVLMSYFLHYQCSDLELTIQYPRSTVLTAEIHARTERPRVDYAKRIEWEDAHASVARPQVAVRRNDVRITIKDPLCGFSYGAKVFLKNEGRPLPERLTRLIQSELITKPLSRHDPANDDLTSLITKELRELLREQLQLKQGEEEFVWDGRLWSRESRRLIAVLGNYQARTQLEAFGYGEGVCGHAFRTCSTKAYVADRYETAREKQLYYVRHPAPSVPRGSDRWILSIPILLTPDGPSVGVVGISSTGFEPRASQRLESLAGSVLDGPCEEAMTMERVVARHFWRVLATNERFARVVRETVHASYLR